MLMAKSLIASDYICQQIEIDCQTIVYDERQYPYVGSGTSYADDLVGSKHCKHESRLCSAICWDLACLSMMCLLIGVIWNSVGRISTDRVGDHRSCWGQMSTHGWCVGRMWWNECLLVGYINERYHVTAQQIVQLAIGHISHTNTRSHLNSEV